MALLREFISLNYDKNIVKEARENGTPVVIKKALLQRADARNQNGRVYSRSILEREVERYRQVIAENRSVGECDHPEDSVVNLKNVSHIIRSIDWVGDDVVGEVEVLDTPSGKIIKSLIEAGIRLGISSRGVGETRTNSNGDEEVDESFNLICWDLVSEPSTVGAFLSESAKGSVSMKKAARIHSIISEILQK